MQIDELQQKVESIKWFHTIDLGNSIVTNGKYDTRKRVTQIGLDEDLSGKSVLDIGAWDGFYSFEAERRGASRVLATDSFIWMGKSWGSKDGFELARKVLNSKVEDKTIDVLDLSPEKVGEFDLVLFLGVLYHMRHPWLSLEKVSSVTKKKLILETEVEMIGEKRPIIVLYPKNELAEDNTNWCAPNPAAVISMLKDVGFKKVEIFSQTSTIRRWGRAILNPQKNTIPLKNRYSSGRMVFHAWK